DLAAYDPDALLRVNERRTVVGGVVVGVAPRIFDPLGNVAVHVVKAEAIRIEHADFNGFSGATPMIERAMSGPAREVGTRRVGGGGATPATIFPLGLAEQPVFMAGDFTQPFKVAFRIVPGNVDHRTPAASPPLVGRAMQNASGLECGVPFVAADGVSPN